MSESVPADATDLKAIKRCIPAFAVAFSGGFLVSVLDPFQTQLIIAFDLCGCSTNISEILVDDSCYTCRSGETLVAVITLRRSNPGLPINPDFLRVREGGPTQVDRWVYYTRLATVGSSSDWVRNLRGAKRHHHHRYIILIRYASLAPLVAA